MFCNCWDDPFSIEMKNGSIIVSENDITIIEFANGYYFIDAGEVKSKRELWYWVLKWNYWKEAYIFPDNVGDKVSFKKDDQ